MYRVMRFVPVGSLISLFATVALACANPFRIPVDPVACAVVGGLLGGAAGVITAHNTGEGETDERLVGGGLGVTGGAVLGYRSCGERAEPLPPVASIAKQPGEGPAPLEVRFIAQADDPDGKIAAYSWSFGDGTTAKGPRPSHSYTDPGRYEVRLTVVDEQGLEASAATQVSVVEVAAAAPAIDRRIVLRGIQFGFDSAEIDASDAAILDVAAETLRAEPDIRARVVGHTDAIGTESYNRALSARRAEAVVNYLALQGIDRSRLIAEGVGELQPVAANDTASGRAENRRVALEILD